MKTIAAGHFRGRCLKVIDQVSASGEPVTITRRGRPIAMIVPADKQPEDIFGCLKGEIEVVGDLVSFSVPLKDWEVLRR